MPANFSFDELAGSDLVIDATYQGGVSGNTSDDPINRILPCGNQGGIRYCGTTTPGGILMCALYSDLADPDWPDSLDEQNGLFYYFGDNKKPGHELHDTSRRGNKLMRVVFESLHAGERELIPPFFLFTKGGKGRDVVFRGLAAPGGMGLSQTDDLIAVWKSKGGKRFQNYRSTFTILDVPKISRAWLDDLKVGNVMSGACPQAWRFWVENGVYETLRAEPTILHRKPAEQLPVGKADSALLEKVVSYFKAHPDREYAFERCAAELCRMMDPNITRIDMTRFRRDGGRDATGKYRIGSEGASIEVDFAIEAKCKNPSTSNSSGVKEVSRLISRLRHRQFGVFVTTSCVGEQAYKEIVEDEHPVIILAGKDIVTLLKSKGINSEEAVTQWLVANFP